eukprot:scaffold20035_cov112-Isochrysis_galbana.AAC.3
MCEPSASGIWAWAHLTSGRDTLASRADARLVNTLASGGALSHRMQPQMQMLHATTYPLRFLRWHVPPQAQALAPSSGDPGPRLSSPGNARKVLAASARWLRRSPASQAGSSTARPPAPRSGCPPAARVPFRPKPGGGREGCGERCLYRRPHEEASAALLATASDGPLALDGSGLPEPELDPAIQRVEARAPSSRATSGRKLAGAPSARIASANRSIAVACEISEHAAARKAPPAAAPMAGAARASALEALPRPPRCAPIRGALLNPRSSGPERGRQQPAYGRVAACAAGDDADDADTCEGDARAAADAGLPPLTGR